MAKKIDASNSSYSSYLFCIFFIPSFGITVAMLHYLQIIGVLFLLILLFCTLWLTLFLTTVISIYKKGKFLWGPGPYTRYSLSGFMVFLNVLIALIALGILIFPKSSLTKAKGNLISSLYFSFCVASVSVLPYIAFIWLVLQLLE